MSVRVTTTEDVASLFDSTSGLAFGPVFSLAEDAEAFLVHLEWIGERDPRFIPPVELAQLAREFLEMKELE